MDKNHIIYFLESDSPDQDQVRIELIKNILSEKYTHLNNVSVVSDKLLKAQVALQDITDQIAKNRVSSLSVFSISHLGDNASSLNEFMEFIGFTSKHDVQFLSVRENIDSTKQANEFAQKLISSFETVRKEIRSLKIHGALMAAKSEGFHIGRPKKADDLKIQELRGLGHSLNSISEQLAISKGAVQYSIRALKNRVS